MHYHHRKGLTLIEILVVIAIIAFLSAVSALSLLSSKNNIILQSLGEILEDNITVSQSLVHAKKLVSSKLEFSTSHPKSYFHTDQYSLTSNQKKKLATNMTIGSYTEITNNFDGSIQISWTAPSNGNDVTFRVEADDNLVQKTESASSPASFSELRDAQNYKFSLKHPVSGLTEKELALFYFSSENIEESSSSPLLLQEIEVEDFDGVWLPVTELEVYIVGSPVKKKFIVENREYLSARITFEKGGEEYVHTF